MIRRIPGPIFQWDEWAASEETEAVGWLRYGHRMPKKYMDPVCSMVLEYLPTFAPKNTQM